MESKARKTSKGQEKNWKKNGLVLMPKSFPITLST
jgi:hypothetical protein